MGTMEERIVLRVVSKFLFPFIIMFGLYIQLHGEYSPGGGFQAGVILAAAFILYAIVFGVRRTLNYLSFSLLKAGCALGVLLYGAVGVAALLKGGEFLNYSVLLPNPVSGQQLGILVIELGVGLTVFSVMLLVFFIFATRQYVTEEK